jgi:hypothetical protein
LTLKFLEFENFRNFKKIYPNSTSRHYSQLKPSSAECEDILVENKFRTWYSHPLAESRRYKFDKCANIASREIWMPVKHFITGHFPLSSHALTSFIRNWISNWNKLTTHTHFLCFWSTRRFTCTLGWAHEDLLTKKELKIDGDKMWLEFKSTLALTF